MITEPLAVLPHINPKALSYEQWLTVGMALHHEGATATDWDNWSSQDPDRYNQGECLRKWDGFRGGGKPKTIASLVSLAKEQGWSPPVRYQDDRAFDWDETIHITEEADPRSDLKILDPAWVETEELREPDGDWNPAQDLIRYLSTLFLGDEYVGYVTESWFNKEAETHLPKKGNYDRTAGQLIDLLHSCDGDIGSVVGDTNPEVGAWIRFNPLDGGGVKDANVTNFRFALVESDELGIGKQYSLMKELELPIAAVVHSGGKSVHAIVRIDADTMEQYRARVDFLYEVCGRNGLTLDRQNRNPSRLSRMPGVTRNDHKQWLIATEIGKASWQEWEEWIIDLNDDLPEIEELEVDAEPELAPELIEGILRHGHKLLLSGSSKAGKSFALIQLAIAIAEGRPWLGWNVSQGRVLYVNLELDERSCRHRFWAIYNHLHLRNTAGQIDVWNLRGSATSMDRLAPKLIRRAMKKEYAAVIIDPIYKALSGDENSAEAMAQFCNQFDRICTQLGAATIICHHHSKGQQGHKQSQDRSSGSGVFARDPDAIIDLIELEIDEARREQIINRWECDAMARILDVGLVNWRTLCPEDDALVADKLYDWGKAQAPLPDVRAKARRSATDATGWRVEATLREFAPADRKTVFFRYPIHVEDEGLLADAKAAGEEPTWRQKRPLSGAEKDSRRQDQKAAKNRELETAIQSKFGEPITVKELAESLGVTEKTARKRVDGHPQFGVYKGVIFKNDEARDGSDD